MAEKAAVVKSKNRFLKLLPKAAAIAAVTFQNVPFSPNKEKRSSKSKGISGASGGSTMISIVPADALHSKSRNSSLREPTSPKVSCMGQVKRKKKLCSLINTTNYYYQDSVLPQLDHPNLMVQNHNNSKQVQKQNPPALKSIKSFGDHVKKKKKPLAIKNMFSRVPSGRRKTSDSEVHAPDDHRASSCSLSQMKRFSSGRSSLSNFDWTTVADQVVDNFERASAAGCKEEVKLSICAAPKIIQECKAVSLEPRKEVSLWKRRTMTQPSPLQLKT